MSPRMGATDSKHVFPRWALYGRSAPESCHKRVFLGWGVLGERPSLWIIAGAALVVGSVAALLAADHRSTRKETVGSRRIQIKPLEAIRRLLSRFGGQSPHGAPYFHRGLTEWGDWRNAASSEPCQFML
jgi:hypothetical protein